MTDSTKHYPAPLANDVEPPEGSSAYYALKMVPTAKRPLMRLWWHWWHEISSIPFNVQDPGVAETKLRWWQQEIQHACADQAQHPITKQLFSSPVRELLMANRHWMTRQIDGQIQLVHQTRWLDQASLDRHVEQTTAMACQAAAAILGANTPESLAAAGTLGRGIRLAHQLARLGQDARAGWVHVAIDALQQHDVKAHELTKPAPKAGPHWPGLLSHLCDEAGKALQEGLAQTRSLPARQRRALKPLMALAHIYMALLEEIKQRNDRVLHERLVLTPVRKWWIAAQVRFGWLR